MLLQGGSAERFARSSLPSAKRWRYHRARKGTGSGGRWRGPWELDGRFGSFSSSSWSQISPLYQLVWDVRFVLFLAAPRGLGVTPCLVSLCKDRIVQKQHKLCVPVPKRCQCWFALRKKVWGEGPRPPCLSFTSDATSFLHWPHLLG